MEDSLAIILLRLCQELSLVNEITADLTAACPADRMKHEVYKFHLAVETELDEESLQTLCNDFKMCYTCFVLSIKHTLRPMKDLTKASGEEYLKKLLKEVTKFIQDIASDMESDIKLSNIGKLCEVIDNSQQIFISLRDFIINSISTQLNQMQSAVEDLQSETSQPQVTDFCLTIVEFWRNVVTSIENNLISEVHGEILIESCKEICRDLDFLVCCVKFI
jgi:gas vesicle protein